MKQMMMSLLLLGFIGIAVAGDGYFQKGSQGIMHFVQVDEDKATDLETYRKAIDDLCEPNKPCQVLFWTENAPVRMPFTRGQNNGKTAYWQYKAKSDTHSFYVDCEIFGTVPDTQCL